MAQRRRCISPSIAIVIRSIRSISVHSTSSIAAMKYLTTFALRLTPRNGQFSIAVQNILLMNGMYIFCSFSPSKIPQHLDTLFQKMLSTIRGLWFVVYEYLNSWFVQKPVIRELDPRETIRSPPAFIKTTKKVVHLPVGLPPKCPQCVRSKDERSKLVSRLHHFSC